jgi:hypothetical protein
MCAAGTMVVLSGCVDTNGQKLSTGGSGSYYLCYVDNRLRGHEVVVASNNNKAAECNAHQLLLCTADIRNRLRERFVLSPCDWLAETGLWTC